MTTSLSSLAAALLVAASAGITSGHAAPAYTAAGSTALGAPDRWDYVVFNAATDRVYAAHGDRVAVLDAKTGAIIGQVGGIAGGTHGIAIAPGVGQGFTDDGKNGLMVGFDLKTLATGKSVQADADADAMLFDRPSGHVFVMEGDPEKVQVFDPKTSTLVASIPVGDKVEYAVSDGEGHVFVNGEGKSQIIRIDTRSNTVDGRYPITDCKAPHGLAMDIKRHRLFSGCINMRMLVINSTDGKVVSTLPIGRGSDAIAYDPVRQRVFSSNGLDGDISVFQQTSPDAYTALSAVPTAVSGRTMDVDPRTGRLFVLASEIEPSTTPGGRPRPKAGTLRIMMFDPIP